MYLKKKDKRIQESEQKFYIWESRRQPPDIEGSCDSNDKQWQRRVKIQSFYTKFNAYAYFPFSFGCILCI
jgi:hypothetical protein